ncbi:MAG TPA: hypothetical protein VGL16_04155 [Actinomycetota bacterium]
MQPLQLNGARRALVDEGLIVEETTEHELPVTTVRLPFEAGRKRELERLRGKRRKDYRRYIAWAQDGNLCGKHAERVVLESASAVASEAGLWVPPQRVGQLNEVNGIALSRGPLDVLAHVLAIPEPRADATLVIEVKNIHSWVYPWTSELWELLVKAAEFAEQTDVLPLLVCVRAAYQTNQLAKDIGFFCCYLGSQVFNPDIDGGEFQAMIDEFGLAIIQHEGPHEAVTTFLTRTLRRTPPLSPPEEDVPWYRRQVSRLKDTAPVILRYQALADGALEGAARSATFKAFRSDVHAVMTWPPVGGW